MKTFVCIAVCLVVCIAGAEAKGISLPKELQTCKRGDDVCLLEAMEKATRFLAGGNSKLGLLPVDPLRVTEIFIDQGSGPVSIKLTLKNQDFLGIKDTVMKSVKTDLKDGSYFMVADIYIPTFKLLGDYKIDGKILVLPINGEGKDNLTLSDLKANFVIKGHVVQRDGDGYVDIDSLLFTFDTSRLYIDLENLFGGDKAVGANMAVFLNDNWRDILDELKPGLEEALSAVFKQICIRIYSRVPYDVLHPK